MSCVRARPSGKAECRAVAVAATPPARRDRDELEEDKRAPFAGRFLGHAPASTSRGTGRDCVLFEDGHSVVGIPLQHVFSKTFAHASIARTAGAIAGGEMTICLPRGVQFQRRFFRGRRGCDQFQSRRPLYRCRSPLVAFELRPSPTSRWSHFRDKDQQPTKRVQRTHEDILGRLQISRYS